MTSSNPFEEPPTTSSHSAIWTPGQTEPSTPTVANHSPAGQSAAAPTGPAGGNDTRAWVPPATTSPGTATPRRRWRPSLGLGLFLGVFSLLASILLSAVIVGMSRDFGQSGAPTPAWWAAPFIAFPVLAIIMMFWYRTRLVGLGIFAVHAILWIGGGLLAAGWLD